MNTLLLRFYALSKISSFGQRLKSLQAELNQSDEFVAIKEKVHKEIGDTLQLPSTFEAIVHLYFSIAVVDAERINYQPNDKFWLIMQDELTVLFGIELSGIELNHNTAALAEEKNVGETADEEIKKELDIFISSIPDTRRLSAKETPLIESRKFRAVSGERLPEREIAIYVTNLLRKCWVIIDEFFPIKKWGLPPQQLIEILMNQICEDGNLKINEMNPFIYSTTDLYGLSDKIQILYLKKKLIECGVDPEDYFEELKLFDSLAVLEHLLEKQPITCIRVDTSNYKGRKTVGNPADLKDKFVELVKQMQQINTSLFNGKKLAYAFTSYQKYIDKYLVPAIKFGLDSTFSPQERGSPRIELMTRFRKLIIELGLNNVEEYVQILKEIEEDSSFKKSKMNKVNP